LLNESSQRSATGRMTESDTVTTEAKARIAEMICKRLETLTAAVGGAAKDRKGQSLRKLAVILRNLGKELRDGLLIAINEKDSDAGKKVANLMILWEDIPQVADRSLQEALRGIDSKKLALALVKADETITKKIRSNISERAAATIDEETSLMSTPKKEDIEQGKEEIVTALREKNEKGELNFIEE
ncbi:MAG: hypothetical protein MUO24_00995, partial [Desulfobacterales bacterium]|nr:hypothetical protein [Desulfobacterales bacterium]